MSLGFLQAACAFTQPHFQKMPPNPVALGSALPHTSSPSAGPGDPDAPASAPAGKPHSAPRPPGQLPTQPPTWAHPRAADHRPGCWARSGGGLGCHAAGGAEGPGRNLPRETAIQDPGLQPRPPEPPPRPPRPRPRPPARRPRPRPRPPEPPAPPPPPHCPPPPLTPRPAPGAPPQPRRPGPEGPPLMASGGARPGGGTARRGPDRGSGSAEPPVGLQGWGVPAAPGHARPRPRPRPAPLEARGAAARAPGRAAGGSGRGPAPGARGRGSRAAAPAALLEEHRLLVSARRGRGHRHGTRRPVRPSRRGDTDAGLGSPCTPPA